MEYIKKNKAAILLYLIIMIGTILLSYSNKQYEKSISANLGPADIQK